MKEKLYRLSKTYSSKVGLDLPYFIKGSFWLSLGQFFNIIRGFLLSVILANLLSKEIFGQYTFIMSIFAMATMFSLPGMGAAITEAVSRNFHGTYHFALKKIFKWSLLGVVFLISISIYGKITGSYYGFVIFLVLALLFPFYSISNYFHRFFHGIKRFDLASKLGVISDFSFVIVLLLVLFFSKSLLFIVLAIVLVQILVNGSFSLIFIKNYISNNKVDLSSIKFGKEYSFSQIMPIVASKIDFLIVGYFLGFEELAIFSIIILIPNQLKSAFTTFTPLILPKISNQITNKKSVYRNFFKILFLSILLIGLYSVIAPIIFKLFYPTYFEYFLLSVFYNLSFIALTSLLFLSYFIKEKKSKIINKINIYSSIFQIVISFILILNFGLIGAIISRMVYRFFNLGINLLFFRRMKLME